MPSVQDGYSTHGEKIAAEVHDLIPFTGLDVGLIVLAALVLLVLGIFTRGVVARTPS